MTDLMKQPRIGIVEVKKLLDVKRKGMVFAESQ
jgi:hypothetical protein